MLSTSAVVVWVVCGIATLILCTFSGPICEKFELLDIPDQRKRHHVATPLMGGLTLTLVGLPLVAAYTLFAAPAAWKPILLTWAACVAAMALLGLADDRHSLAARDRLLLSLLVFASAALVDPMFNVRVLDFEHPGFELGLGTAWLAIIFTTVCCVGLVNAVNMADGKNGLVIGLSLGWLSILATRAPAPLLPVILLLAVALGVLLLFNIRGRLFLGDGGSYGFSTAVGLITIIVYNSPGRYAHHAISAEQVMLLFAIPVLDSFRLTFLRIRQGRSPMSADRNHLHHYLQDRFGWPNGLIVYLVIALVPAALAYRVG